MTDKKQGNAFTNNPIVRAIGVQKIVVVIVLIAMIMCGSLYGFLLVFKFRCVAGVY